MFSNRPPETNGSNSIAESIRKSWSWRLVIHDVNSYGILWDLHLNPSWRITIVSSNLQLTSTEHLMFIQYTSLHMVRKIINIYKYRRFLNRSLIYQMKKIITSLQYCLTGIELIMVPPWPASYWQYLLNVQVGWLLLLHFAVVTHKRRNIIVLAMPVS